VSLGKIKYHLPRLKRLLGKRLVLGPRAYKVHGYNANRFAEDIGDEPHLLPVFSRLLNRPGTFIDVGANTGQTLIKVLTIDPERDYVGFEPQIECCFQIDQFLRYNGIGTGRVVPLALSNENGLAQLFFNGPTDMTASLIGNQPCSSWVCVRRGDELLREMQLDEIAAIKIDVEGFEYEVMSGLADTLKERRPPIVFEVLTNWYSGELLNSETARQERQRRADGIFALLTGLGYSIAQIDAEGVEHVISHFALDERPRFSNDGRDFIAR
jgi:FkbM family methyltransferase